MSFQNTQPTQAQMQEHNAPVARLSRDAAKAAANMSASEARFSVDYYYILQENRKRSDNQTRALLESGEPNLLIQYISEQNTVLEAQVKRGLDKYTDGHKVGSWMKSIHGIGPVIAAGLLAHIDIEKAPTAGHIWSYAGLVPGVKWEKGQKRPWNASLKVLCWKAGQSFMKFSGNEKCFYGQIYLERKAFEVKRNESGDNAYLAKELSEKYAKTTDAYAWTSGCFSPADLASIRAKNDGKITQADLAKIRGAEGSGLCMLPPAQIDARARRYAVKLFLSHLHHVWYVKHYGVLPPKPYAIAQMGHAHMIQPPNFTYTAEERAQWDDVDGDGQDEDGPI